MPSTLLFLLSAFATLISTVRAAFPPKIYGVNLGSWLLIEPWMLPEEWVKMGGETCNDCSKCIASEFAFAQAFPDTVDEILNEHWNTWFNQKDVDELVELGINTVRIPLGYWIVEDLVDRSSEFYPRGGLEQLRRGLRQLKNAGITAVLDHHALPGVSTPNQMFAGRCTSDVQFYTPHNYHRALVWTAVMTTLSHTDPAFGTVTSIEAINEPIMNADLTPGYGDFQKQFVQVIRAVELSLGIRVPGYDSSIESWHGGGNITVAFSNTSSRKIFSKEVASALADAIPIITKIAMKLGLDEVLQSSVGKSGNEPLITAQQDINWQFNNPPNPADAAIGPQIYDNHLYYSFGGVADPNEEAYLTHVCNLDRIERDAALGNSPLFFGEWSLATQFSASDEFLMKWADAQKHAYGRDAGWMFWNLKIETSRRSTETARQWSYTEGVRRGYLTKDPSKFNNANVCEPYKRS